MSRVFEPFDPTPFFDVTRDSHRARQRFESGPFRRLSASAESYVPLAQVSQSLHVVSVQGRPVRTLGGSGDEYFDHSLESVDGAIENLLSHGIRSVFLQLYPKEYLGPAAAVEFYEKVISTLRSRFGDELHIIADSAGLCMGQDLRWGVRNKFDQIDPEQSLRWLSACARSSAEAGTDAFVVVGRMNFEAAAARHGLQAASRPTELWGFSTNTETPNAYFDTEDFSIARRTTGQKILVGNGTEMLLRALRDVYEGMNVVLQKPFENLSQILLLRLLITGVTSIQSMESLPGFSDLVDDSADLFGCDWLRSPELATRLAKARVGAYEVSGTYSTYRLIEETYAPELAFAMYDEQLRNIVWSAGSSLGHIVTRNARWYARKREEIDG